MTDETTMGDLAEWLKRNEAYLTVSYKRNLYYVTVSKNGSETTETVGINLVDTILTAQIKFAQDFPEALLE